MVESGREDESTKRVVAIRKEAETNLARFAPPFDCHFPNGKAGRKPSYTSRTRHFNTQFIQGIRNLFELILVADPHGFQPRSSIEVEGIILRRSSGESLLCFLSTFTDLLHRKWLPS
jgi:hypothetical protein